MDSPTYTLELGDWTDVGDDPADADVARERAIEAVHDISEWTMHCQDVTPKFRVVRIMAIRYLQSLGMTKLEIAEATGCSLHRVSEIIKNTRGRKEVSDG